MRGGHHFSCTKMSSTSSAKSSSVAISLSSLSKAYTALDSIGLCRRRKMRSTFAGSGSGCPSHPERHRCEPTNFLTARRA